MATGACSCDCFNDARRRVGDVVGIAPIVRVEVGGGRRGAVWLACLVWPFGAGGWAVFCLDGGWLSGSGKFRSFRPLGGVRHGASEQATFCLGLSSAASLCGSSRGR